MAMDYHASVYGLDMAQLSAIAALRAMPACERRKHVRGWGPERRVLVYKYLDFDTYSAFSIKKAADIIVESKIYLSAPSQFNDPYDFLANVTFTADPLARRKYFEESARKAIRKDSSLMANVRGKENKIRALVAMAVKKAIDNPNSANETVMAVREKNGVACFSEDPRSLLMWAHYARGHAGICIQFDISEDIGFLGLVQRVNYQKALAKLTWPDDREKVVDDVILRKGDVWASERELRYVSLITARASLPFDGNAMTGIILGSRFHPDGEDALKGLLEQRRQRGGKMPRIFRAKRSESEYAIRLIREML